MRGRRRAVLAAAIVAIAVVAGGLTYLLVRDSDDELGWTSAPASVLPGGSCRAPAPDLGFSRLPAVREPVFDIGSDRLPRVRLGGDGRIVRAGEDYEVTLQDETRRLLTRAWRVEGRMLALDEGGRVVEEVSHETMRGSSERGAIAAMHMDIGEESGFYRLDLRIAGAGRHSGRYGMYLKAAAPHGEGRLAISGHRVQPGEKVRVRLENLGSEPIPYGYGIGLERGVVGAWKGVPREYAVPAVQLFAAGGEAGTCEVLELPRKLPPGRYRLTKEVSTYAEPRGYDDHHLTAEFTVVD